MNILVTGPDGVLGSNLVRELLSREYNVSVLLLEGSKSPTLEGLPITKHYGNILDQASLDKCFEGKDVVIHAAASTSVYPARDAFVNKVNIDGSKNIAEACLKHGIKRLVYVGTANSFEFSQKIDNPGVEDTPYASIKYGLDYMDSKRRAQEIILDYVTEKGLPALIVNPTFMIGPYDSKPSSGAMILALYNGKVPGFTNGGKNYVAVKDAATAIANAVTMGRIGECYILGNENLSFEDAFKRMANVIGVKPPKFKLANGVVIFYGSVNSFLAKLFKFTPAITKELATISTEKHYYSPEKARKELKLPQTNIDIAIKECFDWFKENGYLN